MQMQRLYDAGTEINLTPLRVNPNLPLQASLPSSQTVDQFPMDNPLARTTSKKRRASGTGPGRTPIDAFPQPPAPEVPKAPPVSYRPPYATDNYSPLQGNDPASFAERARALTGKSIPKEPPDLTPEPLPQRARPERRGSLNRPIGGLYAEIQKHKRDSYPPPNGPTSPRRFSNPASPRQSESARAKPSSQKVSPATAKQYQNVNETPPRQKLSSTTTQKYPDSASPVIQLSVKHASTITQPSRKEWAPEHSPLQKLEAELTSKEKKRARVEAAEQKLRESQARDRQRESDRGDDLAADQNTSNRASRNNSATKTRRLSEAIGPDGFRDQQVRESTKSQRRSGRIYSDSYQPLSLDHTNKSSTTSAEKPQYDQQQGRGVRFQGEQDTEDLGAYSSDMDKANSPIGRRSWGTDALAKSDEARAARRDKLRQDPVTVGKRTSSREVPTEQQHLYSERAERLNGGASVEAHGNTPDPVSRYTTHGSQATKNATASQTAAGIQARQMVGFDGGPQGAVERQADRKHHLSTILHRGHNHTGTAFEEANARPRNLDEWKQGGTARLTAADFVIGKEANDRGKTWWQERRSDSRRKPGGAIQTQVLQRDHQDNNGKLPDSHLSHTPKSVESLPSESVIHTRQYVGQEQSSRLQKHSESSHDSRVSHLLHRARNEQLSRLSSMYSYSCTNLADHDPAHFEHICEPYLSKELTLSMRSTRVRPAPALATFNPPLYLKCGPLLRYTGMKRDRLQTQTRSGPSSSERETWRGSIMIVTADADSSYDPAPTLRLFPEAMDLLPPPPQHLGADADHELPPEYIDPIAGLPKLSRSGKTVYVKPVDDLEQGVDLSQIEDDDGLFEEFRTAAVPTAYGTPDFHPGRSNGTSQTNSKLGGRGERATKRGQQVRGVRLHAERGVTFWRFNLEVELGVQQSRVAYSINGSPSMGFWIPGRGQSMNVMFHSCNGFSMSVKLVWTSRERIHAYQDTVRMNFLDLTLFGEMYSIVIKHDRSMS